MPLHAEGEGLDAALNEVTVHRTGNRPRCVLQEPHLVGECDIAERDEAADNVRVAAEVLGRRMDDHVRAKCQWVFKNGVAKVLSTTTTHPRSCAISEIAAMSTIASLGLLGVSIHTTRIFRPPSRREPFGLAEVNRGIADPCPAEHAID